MSSVIKRTYHTRVCGPGELKLPDRSRLYSIMPEGLGTGRVESLTSYIQRLASAHGVATSALVTAEMLPRCESQYLARQEKADGTTWRRALGINGMGDWSADWMGVLQRLTLRNDLRVLTMLPWRQALSNRGLLRRSKAWCAECLGEQRSGGQVEYEPLMWALEAVGICPKHDTQLATTCPSCVREVPVLAPNSRVGECSWCRSWLGSMGNSNSTTLALPNESTMAGCKHIEDLLAYGTAYTEGESHSRLGASLVSYLNETADGSLRELSHITGVSIRSLGDMIDGKQLPQVGTLLNMCGGLNTTPVLLLTGSQQRTGVRCRGHAGYGPSRTRRMRKRVQRPFDMEKTREKLVAARGYDYPPPSMAQVAKMLGYDPSFLYRHFPALCRSISARRAEYVSAERARRVSALEKEVCCATAAVHSRGEYPSYRKVMRELRKPSVMRQPEVLVYWRDALRGLGWDVAEWKQKDGEQPV